MKKEDIILKNFLSEEISNFSPKSAYLDIYKDYDEKIRYIFILFHQKINECFKFMNLKANSNHHYNADYSRTLMLLIEKINELKYNLRNTNYSFKVAENYEKQIKYCDTFLVNSYGSEIPQDYKPFILEDYEPIFIFENIIIKKVNTEEFAQNLKLIGEGAFAKVYSYNDTFYNCKFAKKRINSGVEEKELERFKKEYEFMRKINHPYFLKVYNYNEQENSYIMELCDSTLGNYINKNNAKLTFRQRKSMTLQFLRGINFLHKKSLLHRDLSYNNILLKLYDDDLIIIKIADFGLMKDKYSDLTSTISEIKGTIIDDTLSSFKDYNIKNEIYVIGIIIFYIFTGKYRLELDESALSKIVKKCVDRDHNNRYNNVSEVIEAVNNLVDMESFNNEKEQVKAKEGFDEFHKELLKMFKSKNDLVWDSELEDYFNGSEDKEIAFEELKKLDYIISGGLGDARGWSYQLNPDRKLEILKLLKSWK